MNATLENNILVFAPTYPPAYKAGGPSKTLEALIADAPINFTPYVIAPDKDLGEVKSFEGVNRGWSANHYGPGFINYQNTIGILRSSVFSPNRPMTAIYLNSFFNPRFALFPMMLFWLGKWPKSKLIIAPRGEFHPAALLQKSKIKSVIIKFVKAIKLNTKVIWHASSDQEETFIRNIWGEFAQIIVREDETGLPKNAEIPVESYDDKAKIVFLSRLVPNKGLHVLLKSLSKVTNPVILDIFGPEEDQKYVNNCRLLAKQTIHSIEFHGPISPDKIRQTFSNYDLFAFPTEFESFGHVIPEALSVSCPVAVPDTTPWTDLLHQGGGFVLENPIEENLTNTIQYISSQPKAVRFSLRMNSKKAYDSWAMQPSKEHIFELINNPEGP